MTGAFAKAFDTGAQRNMEMFPNQLKIMENILEKSFHKSKAFDTGALKNMELFHNQLEIMKNISEKSFHKSKAVDTNSKIMGKN